MQLRINMTVSNPPLKRVFDVLDWLAQVLVKLTCLRSNALGYRYVCKGVEVIIVIIIIIVANLQGSD